MTFSVHILRRALSDADGIFNWIAARSPAGGARWYSAFLSAAHDLSNNPFKCGTAPESETIGRDVATVSLRHAAVAFIGFCSSWSATK